MIVEEEGSHYLCQLHQRISLPSISLLISDYSTLNERDHNRTLDRSGEDMEPMKGAPLVVNTGISVDGRSLENLLGQWDILAQIDGLLIV